MNDQPKPASGEWTRDTVKFWNFTQIADAHNAALGAAWRKGHADAQEPALERIDDLHQQLAAEREKLTLLNELRFMGGEPATYEQLREQLAAEREKVQTLTDALKEVNALARGNLTGCGTCNHVIDATIRVL